MQLNVNESYKMLINSLSSNINKYGFIKKRSSFLVLSNNNWGIINFQKSTKSTSTNIEFTVNLGVLSSKLFGLDLEPNRRFDIWNCHWRVRVGALLGEKKDLWWSINDSTSIEEISDNFQHLLTTYGIPEIFKHIKDSSLRDLWLSGNAPSLTKYQRLKYLSILLREIGPASLIPSIDAELNSIK